MSVQPQKQTYSTEKHIYSRYTYIVYFASTYIKHVILMIPVLLENK